LKAEPQGYTDTFLTLLLANT